MDPFGLLTIFIPGAGPDSPGWANWGVRQLAERAGGQYVSRHWFRGTKEAIREAAQKGEPIKIVGYSRGAVSALKLARDLEKEGIKVDVLITLDPVALVGLHGSYDVPRNVRRAFNYYQDIGGNPLRGEFRGTPLSPRGNVYNIKVPQQLHRDVRHPQIPVDPDVQKAVLVVLGNN
jgi:pimeloyl-ACP methyl ester carboxylesterase